MVEPVRRRHVFYIGGFDPKGVSSFFQQHKIQLQKYVELTGIKHSLSSRSKARNCSHQWTVQAENAQGTTHTTFEYLAWDDIVRKHWSRNTLAILRQASRCLFDFLASGAIKPLYKLAPATARTSLVPYALVVSSAVAITFLCALVYMLSIWLGASQWSAWLGTLAMAIAGTAIAWKALKNVQSMWFLRVVDFARILARNEDRSIQLRIDTWCDHILETLKINQADEIIIVGYSAGSSLSVPLLAQLIRRQGVLPVLPDKLCLLTLGNCIPVAASLKSAKQTRSDIAVIGASQLTWLDFTAPIDWGSFPLVNPITVYAPRSDAAPLKRRFVSPQFHLLFEPDMYQKIRMDKYHVHQLYLQCAPKVGRYDYFGMLYGQSTISHRIQQLEK